MQPSTIRSSFLSFAGPTKYRKFATRFGHSPAATYEAWYSQLRFWAQTLWDDFSHLYDDPTWQLEMITLAFSECHIHSLPLSPGQPFADPLGVARDTTTFPDRFDALFPFGFGRTSLICPTCLTECRAWLKNQRWSMPIGDFQAQLLKYRRLTARGTIATPELACNLTNALLPLSDADMAAAIQVLDDTELAAFDSYFASRIRPKNYTPDLHWIAPRHNSDENEDTRQRLRPRYKLIDTLVSNALRGDP